MGTKSYGANVSRDFDRFGDLLRNMQRFAGQFPKNSSLSLSVFVSGEGNEEDDDDDDEGEGRGGENKSRE